LLDLIKNFFSKLDPDIIVQSPSRINLINPLDAVEADFWMPSIAINGLKNPLSVFCYIKEIEDKSCLKIYRMESSTKKITITHQELIIKNIEFIKSKFKEENKLFYATLYRFSKTNSHFWRKFINKNIEFGILSTIPRQSGLGGSASIIVGILFTLAKYFQLINNLDVLEGGEFPINRDIIAEMATLVEDKDLKITAGYGDRYSISRGGISFCSYFGKLNHRRISKEPLAICDRIDRTYKIDNIPIIVCYSGVTHESGNVHKKLREIYLKKDEYVLNKYKEIGKISWKSRFALMSKNWELLGKYCKKNTRLMNEIMRYAGFKFGIGLSNNILIKLIENQKDVYSVKLTGAGGGGSVFALVNPEKIDEIIKLWYERLIAFKSGKLILNLDFQNNDNEVLDEMNVRFFKVQIDKKGVKKIY
jgi:galactokinase/mevalonate kinase-like predicted kinase